MGEGPLRSLVDTEDSCEAANMIQRGAQGRGRKVTGVEASGGSGEEGEEEVAGRRHQQIQSTAAVAIVFRPGSDSGLKGRGVAAAAAACSAVPPPPSKHD